MKRRDFITLSGAAAAAWQIGAGAQPARRRVAVVMLYPENDSEGLLRATAFRQGIERAGWISGRNLSVDYLWGAFDADWTRTVIERLQQFAPDVVVANGTQALRAIEPAIRMVPIVFIGTSEPVAQGIIGSLARPGGHITGFSNLEPSLGSKWLDLLKEMVPTAKRAVFMFHPDNVGSTLHFQSAQAVAKKFVLEVVEAKVRELSEIEAAVTMLGREPGGVLVLPPEPFTATHRKRIIELAVRDRLPVVSALRSFVDEGGLLAYGVNIPELFRQAAGYVDRILRGEQPGDLPVQQPVRFEMVINMKAAKMLGLTVPLTLQVVADEVIE